VQFLYESGLIAEKGPVVNLRGADVSRADLANVRLGDAKLRKADLSGANLSGIWELTDEQLGTVKTLAGATMPNGQKYEEWLKDREGRKKDGENE
jgi:hypothetical protein